MELRTKIVSSVIRSLKLPPRFRLKIVKEDPVRLELSLTPSYGKNPVIVGLVAALWFGEHGLGIVIALAMLFNLFVAGFFGAAIPLLLQRWRIDPALGASILLTTVTDVVGFFVFLGLAHIMLT